MKFIQKYYTRSSGAALPASLLLAAIGCAGPNQIASGAPRFAFSDLNGSERRAAFASLAKGAAVVHFRRGDQVPLRFVLDSSLADLKTPELVLVVKRDFYALIDPGGPPRVSENGVDFESKPKNYFFYGFNVPKAGDASMVLRIGLRPRPPR
jgi:hypothetical protein